MNSLIHSKPVIGKDDWFVLKYDRNVFYDNLWNTDKALLECRGHIVDSHGAPIAKPFTKVFNYCENGAGKNLKDDTIVWADRKINGSMFHVTNTEFGILYGTTGSAVLGDIETENDFLNRGRDIFKNTINIELFSKQRHDVTFMFEVVDNINDPHVVYDEDGLYLLAARSINGWMLPRSDIELFSAKNNHGRTNKLKLPEYKVITFGDLCKEVSLCVHEGFMVSDTQGYVCKIKSPYYLNKKRAQRIKPEKLFSKDWREYFDDDFYGTIEEIHRTWTLEKWAALDEASRSSIFQGTYNLLLKKG